MIYSIFSDDNALFSSNLMKLLKETKLPKFLPTIIDAIPDE